VRPLTGPLTGVRVLEIDGGIAAPFCTRLFAQYGAQVIKIEEPGRGDPTRHRGPFVGHRPNPETSVPFLYLNTNKQSITLDLGTKRGARILTDLTKETDIIVESTKPGMLTRWGIGWETLRAVNPHLILTSVTGFGQDGPYRDATGTEIVLAALGGIMYMSGPYDREPIMHGHPQSQFMGGLHAAGSTMIAYFNVMRGGSGEWIDVSMQAGVTHELVHVISLFTYMGAVHGRGPRFGGSGQNGAGNGFGGIVPFVDGFVAPDAPPDERWDELADFLDIPALKDDRFRSRSGRVQHAAALDALVLPALQRTGRYDFFHHAQSNGWSTGVVQTMSDLASCPQLDARGFWTELDHPVAGPLRYPADFCRMSETPGALIEPAPLLGQHNQAVFGDRLGYTKRECEALRSQGVI